MLDMDPPYLLRTAHKFSLTHIVQGRGEAAAPGASDTYYTHLNLFVKRFFEPLFLCLLGKKRGILHI